MHWIACFFFFLLTIVRANETESTKIKAAIVILCRNSDLDDIRRSLREFEDRFNRRYRYPYVFFNDKPFSNTFKEKVMKHISAPASFELLSPEEWSIPPFLNQSRINDTCHKMKEEGIIYGGSISYRHMCHWYSGYFFRHPALADYEWYWRLEPGVHFFCDIHYDPFEFMVREGKLYGFNIALREIEQTVPSLWNSTLAFREQYGSKYQSPLLKDFFEKDGRYNLCHFWSNFEIASLNLWRSPDYLAYFNYLDQKGGFYYERWGDAPVHSLYVGMRLTKDQVHFFNDIGYQHESLAHCDASLDDVCQCPKDVDPFANTAGSCLPGWLKMFKS